MSDTKSTGPIVKPSIPKPRHGTSVDRLSRATQRSASRDSMIKSRDPSTNCTSPTGESTRRLPPIKAPVGLARGPDLKNVRSKIGSLQNVKHKPAAGEKKVITQKLEWQAKPRIGSLDYVKHRPAGGDVKIENKKLEWKAKPKVGSLDNVNHKPGGGQVNIFDEKYASKTSSTGGRSPSENRSISPSSTTNSVKSACNTPIGARSPLPSVSSSGKDGKENKPNESSERTTKPSQETNNNNTSKGDPNSSKVSTSIKTDENNNEKAASRPNSLTSSVKG